MSSDTDKFNKLREEGYRITPQRKTLLEFFYKLPEGEHLSAEEIHRELVNSENKISLATLYRSLKFLLKEGFIRELDFGEDHKHYELNCPNNRHHHIICNMCGKAIEFEDKNLYDYAYSIAYHRHGFDIKDCQFKIFGICPNCADK